MMLGRLIKEVPVRSFKAEHKSIHYIDEGKEHFENIIVL